MHFRFTHQKLISRLFKVDADCMLCTGLHNLVIILSMNHKLISHRWQQWIANQGKGRRWLTRLFISLLLLEQVKLLASTNRWTLHLVCTESNLLLAETTDWAFYQLIEIFNKNDKLLAINHQKFKTIYTLKQSKQIHYIFCQKNIREFL